MRPIIRAVAAAALLWLPACAIGGSGSAPASPVPAPSPALSPKATASPPALPASVWVLTPVGANLRADPDTTAPKVTTVAQGVQLDVLGARQVGTRNWLQVRGHESGSTQGWIVDEPEIVTRTPVNQSINSPNGYSLLFPQSWTRKDENPNTVSFTGSSSGHSYQLLIQSTDDISRLMPVPTKAGRAVREQGPVEVYGKTTFITIYKIDGGGLEMSVKLKWADQRAYLFLFRQLDSDQEDVPAFKQFLDSVSIFG